MFLIDKMEAVVISQVGVSGFILAASTPMLLIMQSLEVGQGSTSLERAHT